MNKTAQMLGLKDSHFANGCCPIRTNTSGGMTSLTLPGRLNPRFPGIL